MMKFSLDLYIFRYNVIYKKKRKKKMRYTFEIEGINP